MKKRFFKVVLPFLLFSILMAPVNAVAEDYVEPKRGIDNTAASPATITASTTGHNFKTSEYVTFSSMQNAVKKYKAVNDDVKAWLLIPNTNINMPILKTADNDYYSYRDWQKNYYPNTTWRNFKNTATYADYRTAISNEDWNSNSRNTVLYGHNWTNLRNPMSIGKDNNHIMFGQLPSYTSQKFAQANPYIYYSTEGLEGIWKVFAVGYCEVSIDFFYNSPNPSDELYQKILDEWKLRSMYDFGTDVNINDRILTLSTCTRQYGASEDQRFVVVARLLRDGESEKDSVTVTARTNVKQPKL